MPAYFCPSQLLHDVNIGTSSLSWGSLKTSKIHKPCSNFFATSIHQFNFSNAVKNIEKVDLKRFLCYSTHLSQKKSIDPKKVWTLGNQHLMSWKNAFLSFDFGLPSLRIIQFLANQTHIPAVQWREKIRQLYRPLSLRWINVFG